MERQPSERHERSAANGSLRRRLARFVQSYLDDLRAGHRDLDDAVVRTR